MATTGERYDFYYAVHKGLRLGHARLLPAIGSTDLDDPDARDGLIAALRGFLTLARSHLHHENAEIHAALEIRRPGASAHAAEDHDDHERTFAEIDALLARLEDATGADAAQAGRALYRRWARFIADDFAHMEEEEGELLRVLQDSFDDRELQGIEQRIISAIPPAEMTGFMRLIVAAMSHAERVGMLGAMKAGMPAAVFGRMIEEAVRPSIDAADMRRLDLALAA